MTEQSPYTEENFNLSYESKQKELRRLIISLRSRRRLSVAETAHKSGIDEEKLNAFELGNEKISLLEFAKILDAFEVYDSDFHW